MSALQRMAVPLRTTASAAFFTGAGLTLKNNAFTVDSIVITSKVTASHVERLYAHREGVAPGVGSGGARRAAARGVAAIKNPFRCANCVSV